MKRSGILIQHDVLPYETAWELQKTLVEELTRNLRPDTLLLLEHQPVFTLGRTTKLEHWGGDDGVLRARGCSVYQVERGGSVTYHGPGQLVGYPILRLNRYCPGPRAYLRLLEEVVIRTLAEWGIQGRRIEKLPGVWVGHEQPVKIAAMGVRIARGVTMHGFSLNVTVDTTPFSWIVPCGIEEYGVTSMAAWLGCPVNMADIRHRIGTIFAEVFDIQWDKVLLGVGAHEAPDRRVSDFDRTLAVKSSSPEGA
jgi:lipoate-protein ligase B